jgi:hypothetical protein
MEAARTYRTRLALRIAVGAAAAFWAAVLAVLAGAPGVPLSSRLSAAAFLVFFLVFSFVYGRTSITVTPSGVVAATPFRRRPIDFEDILEIVVQDGIAGRVYAVVTRRGLFHFTSLFARHRELFEILLARSGLRRSR